MECFVCYGHLTMTTWRDDWRDKRIDRIEKRVCAIEEARRKEKQRALERLLYLMLAVVWLVSIGSVVLALIESAST